MASSFSPTTTMMTTLDDMKEELGDGKYLQLASQLAAIRAAAPVLYTLTYRHEHLSAFINSDYKAVTRSFSSHHQRLCKLVPITGTCLYDQIHFESTISQHAVDEIRDELHGGPGYAVRTSSSDEGGCVGRQITIVKCERV